MREKMRQSRRFERSWQCSRLEENSPEPDPGAAILHAMLVLKELDKVDGPLDTEQSP